MILDDKDTDNKNSSDIRKTNMDKDDKYNMDKNVKC
jgi:hypothetical protein